MRQSTEAVAPMHEHNAFGFANEVECPVERRVAAAKDDDILPSKTEGSLQL